MKRSVSDYRPYDGFYDLRDFDIPKKEFLKLWKIQEYLDHVNQRRDYFRKHNPGMFRECQELSGQYQQILLAYPQITVSGGTCL